MDAHYKNDHIYVGDDEITSRRHDLPPQRKRSNFKEVSNTTSTQNSESTAIIKMNGKLRIVFSVTVVFFIVSLAVFGVLAYWISKLNIQNIEHKDQQSTGLKVIEELKNETRVFDRNLFNMMNEQKDQQSKNFKLIKELKNETRVSDGNLINMMNEQKDQQSTKLKLIKELKNETKVSDGNLVNMMNEQKDQQSTKLKLINELKNETRVSDGNLINMMNDLIKKLPCRYPEICYVGISTGLVKLSQLSASSVHEDCPLHQAILNSGRAWCAAKYAINPWIQVDYLVARTITAILTQGRADLAQWVKSFQISYGNTTSEMQYYQELGKVKVFVGNSDESTIVENDLSPSIHARFVRIHPVSYHNHRSMRIEMRDC